MAGFNKKILVGATESEIVVVKLALYEQNAYTYELSFSGECYSRIFINDSDGEDMAWNILNDSGIWEDAVHDRLTEDSKAEYYENLLRADGWEQVVGDVEYLDDDKYSQLVSCGQIDMHVTPHKFEKQALADSDLEFVFSCWKKYHMKPLKRHVSADQLARLISIFSEAPRFEIDQLIAYGR